uniref:Uncharacterized protein LOC113788751 n=1 Tax=Dermatophagoides pteronyssinus TaxID=6956 RepID=A0A6P6XMK1_DERPT|nr:uncharacterized protein LOC113788751 [Dermatophagoides pteronyssinus]
MLFIINIIILILPIIYWLLLTNGYRKLLWIKNFHHSNIITNKNDNDNLEDASDDDDNLNEQFIYQDYSFNSDSIQIQIDGPSTPPPNLNDYRQQKYEDNNDIIVDDDGDERKSFMLNETTIDSQLIDSHKKGYRILFWEEIFIQLSYLLLIIVYLGELIELLILNIGFDNNHQHHQIDNFIIKHLELINIILKILIHLILYGVLSFIRK